MSNNGWIKLHRSITDWEWYTDPNTLCLWIHILLSVNHEQKKWRGMVIEAGQMVTSYASLSKKSGLSIQSVRTSLNKLKSTGEITCKSTHQNTLITVVKWAEFQADDRITNTPINTQTNTQPTSDQHTTNTRLTTNKNDKNDKNVKNKRNIYVAPTLEEVSAYCKERQNNVDPERFVAYYESQHWKKANGQPLEDWKAAVRYWERTSYDKPRNNSQPSVTIDTPDYIRKQIEEMDKKFGW